MKLGTETGNLMNHLYSRTENPTPEVGMGCTMLYWTDRHAGTVIEVSASGKTVTVQEDDAKRIDGNGMSDCQSWEYSRNPNGRIFKFRLTKRGWKEIGGSVRLSLGHRSRYHDFSF